MNNFDTERKNNKILYRELFFRANAGFKEQINGLKAELFCKNKKICCKIRYLGFSPCEINSLRKEGEKTYDEYAKFFLPYGAGEDFDYENNNYIDIKLNNELAENVEKEYVNTIIKKLQGPIYFYYCKNINNNNHCYLEDNKKQKSLICSFPHSITTLLPKQCGYRKWQQKALEKIQDEISKDILIKLKEINLFREQFNCKKTGTCCRLAGSEFSYKELKEKAGNGDKFAGEFTSIFIPYENLDEVKKLFPDYVEMVMHYLDEDEKVYFYHCPHVTENNLCSIYEKRPEICLNFPRIPSIFSL